MRVATWVSVVLAVAVGGGVGLWIRRSSERGSAEDARIQDPEREAEDPRSDGKRAADVPAPSSGTPTAPTPSPAPPESTYPVPSPGNGNPVLIVTPADVPIPGEPEPGPPKYLIAGHEGVLKAVDWTVVGKNLSLITPVAAQFAATVAKTGAATPELAGRMGELNGPLTAAAIKARDKSGVTNANGAFTHPAFMVNAIAATLEAAGKPLTEEQGASLSKTAKLYADREKARIDGYEAHVFALAKVIDEAALRDDFFAAAHDVLTPEQRAALWPEGPKDRLGLDLFSTGPFWGTVVRPVPFKEKDVLVTDVTESLVSAFSLPEDRRPIARAAAVEYVNSIPAAVFEEKPDGLSKMGFPLVPSVRDSAKRWLALLQRLVQQARLDEETTVRVRANQGVTVPIRIE